MREHEQGTVGGPAGDQVGRLLRHGLVLLEGAGHLGDAHPVVAVEVLPDLRAGLERGHPWSVPEPGWTQSEPPSRPGRRDSRSGMPSPVRSWEWVPARGTASGDRNDAVVQEVPVSTAERGTQYDADDQQDEGHLDQEGRG
ncbi:hypothetical protein GCM10029964_036620 [Kibdelosporangium lantanae]